MVIDAHIHLYPAEVFADPQAWGTARRESWWTQCVAPPDRRSLQGWAAIDQLLRDMDAAGIDQAVLLGWYWENHNTCVIQNNWYSSWQRAHPDRLHAFATVNPAAGHAAIEETRRCFEAGFLGLGELLPAVQGFSFSDEPWAALMELCAAWGKPVNLHVSDPGLLARAPLAPTPLNELVAVAKAFPHNRFVLAHWGGGLPWLELNRRTGRALGNCVYDCAASPLLYDPAVYARCLDLVGPHRLCFGTDYPLLVYPKTQTQPSFREALEEARSNLPAAAHQAFFGGNIQRVLGLAGLS
ncbi:MAG: amidohydrolase family protein [Opitutales bacterium]